MTAAKTVTGEHWPCPHGCMGWCRTDGSKTNHHPRCEFVDESLIDVWKVSDGSTHYYNKDEAAARHEAIDCEDITITKVKMHLEIYENLPEFDGF